LLFGWDFFSTIFFFQEQKQNETKHLLCRFFEKKQLRMVENHVVKLLPQMLKEKIKFPCNQWKFDKIFASEWFDEDTVYFGTKCNKVKLLNCDLKERERERERERKKKLKKLKNIFC